MRERVEIFPAKYQDVSATFTNYLGAETITNSTITTYSGYREMHDVVTPDFRKKQARGEIVNNPLSIFKLEEYNTPLDYDIKWEWDDGKTPPEEYYTQTTVGQVNNEAMSEPFLAFLPAPDLTADIEYLSNLATTRAFANVSVSDATALISMGEGRQTVVGMIKLAKRLNKLLSHWDRRELKKLITEDLNPSEIADLWMEVRYGLRPLLYDYKNIVKAMKHTKKIGERQTFRSFYEKHSFDEADYTVSRAYWDTYARHTVETQIEVRAGILGEVERYGWAAIWGIYDIPEAALELTRLSFVADWFFNLADVVSSFNVDPHVRLLARWLTVKTVTTQTARITGIGNFTAPFTGGTITSGIKSKITETVTRTPDLTRTLIPQSRINLDWMKLIDLTIIGRNILSSIKGKKRFIPR
jgi:hypothetical protein